MKAKTFFLSLALMSAATLWSATLEQAKSVYNKGDYAKALPMMMEQHKKSPKNGSIAHWLGVCLYNTGERQKSKQYFELAASRNVAEANKYLAKICYDNYDFTDAEDYLDDYEAALTKAKKPLDDVTQMKSSLNKARMMLDHVEQIVIIDSISVDKQSFLLAYNMSPSCGTLGNADLLPDAFSKNGVSIVQTSESGERIIWAQTDSKGISHLYESVRLIQGWDDKVRLDKMLNDGCDAAYPFMMQDGLTIYYAGNGNNSLGGYDIFMTRKDVETGDFFVPSNIGMPYNSPYDDYMLVIDEGKNIGWWATDRNQIPGKITIYTFIPNSTRINYDADDDNIADKALIKNYRDTWGKKDYSAMAADARNVSTYALSSIKEFSFHVYNGVVYRTFNDFKTPSGEKMMEELLVMQKHFDSNKARLANLRKKYETASASEQTAMRSNILQLENSVDKARKDIEYMENSIRKAERN